MIKLEWDQVCMETFLVILKMLERGKQVDVTLTTDKQVYHIENIMDVENILPSVSDDWVYQGKELPESVWKSILDVFMPSPAMKEYLTDNPVPKKDAINLILSSPASLEKKYRFCNELSKTDDLMHDVFTKCKDRGCCPMPDPFYSHDGMENSLFSIHAKAIKFGLDGLQLGEGERFTLYHSHYEFNVYKLWEDNAVGSGMPFLSLDEVMAYVKQFLSSYKNKDSEKQYTFVLEKWHICDDGKMEKRFIYYLIDDEIVGFEYLLEKRCDGSTYYRDRCIFSRHSLEIPVPFQVGDFVTLDCRPYAPPQHGLLLTPNDAILFKDRDGRWRIEYISFRDNAGDYNRCLSPLYHIAAYKGELKPEEELLRVVQRYLDGNKEKGCEMWQCQELWPEDIDIWEEEYPDIIGDARDEDLLKYMKENGLELTKEEKERFEKVQES